jgi:nondiscriminating aspartyl-tRNA synthetase
MSGVNQIHGRVTNIKKLRKNLRFIIISMDGNRVECVDDHEESVRLSRGDFITATGQFRRKVNSSDNEFSIETITSVCKPRTHNALFDEFVDLRRIEALRIRTIMVVAISNFFLQRNFTPVHSPIIVGDWVKGQTRAFKVEYHRGQEAYLTISTIVHHQLIQSMGYGRIFEIARLFRRNNDSSPKKLSEFTNIVIGMLNSSVEEVIAVFGEMINVIYCELRSARLREFALPAPLVFDRITFDQLLCDASTSQLSGHQLSLEVRTYMNERFPSFVWVTGFPEHTRPFYVKSSHGICDDCQLWFKGRTYLATGGVIETNPDTIALKIAAEGKDIERFRFHIDALELGVPPMANIDMGIERFLGHFFDGSQPAEFSFFPRYSGRVAP